MEVYNISRKEFKKMKEYELANDIFNTECKLFVMPVKDKWSVENKLLKRFYLLSGIMFGNKLKTINSLIDIQKYCDIDQLILPEKLAVYEDRVVGYIMKLVNSDNLKTLLDDFYVPLDDKISYFKQIGSILREMKNFRKYGNKPDFFLNDMHSNNFVVEKETGRVYVCDLDSSKIDGNMVFGSMMLSYNSPAYLVNKYKFVTDGRCGGILEPDENTDLFCYNIMILNFLYNGNILSLDMNGFYQYLDYLSSLGLNKELLDIFAKVYDMSNNENPDYLLDYLKDVYPQSLFPVYKRKKL